MAKEEAAVADPNGTPDEGTSQVGLADAEAFYTDPDGTAYSSKDELDKAWAGRMSRDEHLRRSTEFDKRQKSFEAQQRDFDTERKRVEALRDGIEDYNTYDKYVNSHPDTMRRWKEEVQKGASANDVREQIKAEMASEYGVRLDEIDAWKQAQEGEAQRRQIFDVLKGKYKNFNEKAMDELLTTLQKGDPETIADTLHWSLQGRRSQTEIAEELAEGEKENDEAGIPGNASVSSPRKSKIPANASIDEMRERGKARYNNTS